MNIPWMIQSGRRWFVRLWPEAWIVRGAELHSGLPLSVLFATESSTGSYLVKLFFAPGCRQEPLGHIPLCNLRRTAARAGCQMMLPEVHYTQRPRDAHFVPVWVHGAVELPLAVQNHSLKQDLRQARLHRLQVTIARDHGTLERFYHEMYVPTLAKSHGDSAVPRELEELVAGLPYSDLLLANSAAGWVGGLMLAYEKPFPRLWCLGVREGDRKYLRQGVVTTLYDFAFRHLAEAGYSRVNLGLSRAFLNDGVLRYKQKFGHKVTRTTDWGFALTVIEPTPATESVLRNNPFVASTRVAKAAAVASPDSPVPAADSPAPASRRALPRSAG
jgi:hypothetical protein